MLVQVSITSFGILSGDMHLYVYIYTYISTYIYDIVRSSSIACMYIRTSFHEAMHQRVPVCSDVRMYVLQGIIHYQLSVEV